MYVDHLVFLESILRETVQPPLFLILMTGIIMDIVWEHSRCSVHIYWINEWIKPLLSWSFLFSCIFFLWASNWLVNGLFCFSPFLLSQIGAQMSWLLFFTNQESLATCLSSWHCKRCTRHRQWPGSRCLQHPLLAAMTVVVVSSVKVCLELCGKTGSFKGVSLTEHAKLPFPLCCREVLELGPQPCSLSWFSHRKWSKSPRLFQPTSLFWIV